MLEQEPNIGTISLTVGDNVLCNLYYLGIWWGSVLEIDKNFCLISISGDYNNRPFDYPVWISHKDIIRKEGYVQQIHQF